MRLLTDRRTDEQTKGGWNITSLAEVIKSVCLDMIGLISSFPSDRLREQVKMPLNLRTQDCWLESTCLPAASSEFSHWRWAAIYKRCDGNICQSSDENAQVVCGPYRRATGTETTASWIRLLAAENRQRLWFVGTLDCRRNCRSEWLNFWSQFNSVQFYFKNKQTNRCMYNK